MRTLRLLWQSSHFRLLGGLALLWILIMAAAPYLTSSDPYQVHMGERLLSVSGAHWMGTDQLGRDEMVRILWGGRISLSIAFLTVVLTAILGVLLGTIMALGNGRAAAFCSGVLDFFLSLPTMVFTISLIGILGPGLFNIVFSLVVTKWAEYARVTRTLVEIEKSRGYIRLAPFAGASPSRVVGRYILPNVVPQLLVFFCQHISEVILTVAGLSLIGIGIQPPWPEWGTLLMNSRAYMQTAPWLLFFPGLFIFITVLIFNLLGDVMRDALDPHDEGRA